MTIEKGGAWGGLAADLPPSPRVTARSDAEAAQAVEQARRGGSPLPVLVLLGGDLCRTVGGTGVTAHAAGPDAVALPCDVGSVLLDGRLHWFVAHLVARRSWWRGRLFAAMNAQFLGRYDVAPRGHPGDGRLDVLDVDPTFGLADRVKAWRRLPTGTHVPHPRIRVRSTAALQTTFDPPLRVWLDGVDHGEVSNVSLRVEADALTVVV
jgi:YegS C-terminal NAD kinase beta sandwich-like domain